jgi:PAS domain S-box-containing protein
MSNPSKTPISPVQLKYYAWALAAVWTVVIAASLGWNLIEQRLAILAVAKTHALVAYEKDLIYRRWSTGQGGVYVPVTERTQPNPHLDVPEREIKTPSGRLLTLMNPAYMTRQVYDMAMKETGVVGHITSLKPIRPENAADPWETQALEAFEQGTPEVISIEKIHGERYFRLMRPFITEKGCLKCHAAQGYREGDIRGGISVSVPLAPLRAVARRQIAGIALGHGGLWLVGLVGIGWGWRGIGRRVQERLHIEQALGQSEQRYRTLMENLPIGVYRNTPGTQGQFLAVNPAHARMLGYDSVEELLKSSVADLYVNPAERKAFSDRLMAEGSVTRAELRLKKKDGTPIWGAVTANTVRNEAGEIEYFDGTIEDITERKEWEDTLKESEEKFRSIVESVGMGVALINNYMEVLETNETMRQWFPLVALEAHPLYHTVLEDPPLTEPRPDCPVAQTFRDWQIHETVRTVVKRGIARHVRFRSSPVHSADGELMGVILLLEDMTNREIARQRIETAAHLVAEISRLGDRKEILELVIRRVTDLLAADYGVIAELNPQTGAIGAAYSANFPTDLIPAEAQVKGQGVLGRIVRGEVVWTPDVTAESEYIGYPAWHPRVGPCIGLPLRLLDKVLGIMLIGRESGKEPFAEEDRNYAVALSHHAAVAIDRTRRMEALHAALEESRQHSAETLALLKGSRAVLESRDFHEAAESIFNSCRELTGAAAGYVTLISSNETEGEILVLDRTGFSHGDAPSLAMPILRLHADAYHAAKPVYDNEFSKSEWTQSLPEGQAALNNVLFAPLMIKGKAVGMLGLANKIGGFTENDGRVAAAFADLAAIALFNSRTLESLEKSEERYRTLIQNLPVGLYRNTPGPQGKFLIANPGIARMFGYESVEEFLTTAVADLYMDPSERKAFSDKLLAQGNAKGEELRLKRKNGTEMWGSVTVNIVRNASGEIEYFDGMIEDITERKRFEEELRWKTAFLEAQVNSSLDGILVIDREGQRILRNERITDLWKVPQHILDQKDDEALLQYVVSTTKHPEQFHEKVMYLYAHPNETSRDEIEFKDGMVLDRYSSPVLGKDGKYYGRVWTFRDITERKRAEEALRNAMEWQKRILATAATAILTVDTEQRITSVNEEFCTITGFSQEEAVGKSCDILQGDPCTKGCGLFDPKRTEPIRRKQCAIHTKGGRCLTIIKNADLIRDESGRITGGIESFVDVTALAEAREEAEKAREEAMGANRAKSEFLANMSHEIRTPMNGIIGMTELAMDTDLTPEQREYLEMVKSSANSLLTLLNDILDLSKIEARQLGLENIDFGLRTTIGLAIEPQAIRAHQKGLELITDIHPNVPETLVGDPTRLRQVVINLVGNAVKFTESGEVVIRVRMIAETDDKVELHFSVADTGIGIPADKQAMVFEAFAQADSSTTRKYGGSGLGLAITRQLVQMMGGRIWVKSEAGKGSTFHFTAQFGIQSRPAKVEPPRKPVELAGMRVLVVDDNQTNRRILKEMLTRWGMEVKTVASGPEAIAEVDEANKRGRSFDLVLLDAQMPGMDGFTVAENLRKIQSTTPPTVMMLTSMGQRGDAEHCREVGIAVYLVKPIKQSEMFDAIVTTLGRGMIEAELRSVITRHTLQEARRRLRVLVAEDNAVNRKLVLTMLQKRGHEAIAVEDGRQAVDLSAQETFDLILMDVQMPQMDGYKATKLIREREKQTGRHIPIIAMTAHAMKGDREKCLEAGMDDYVPKPVQAARLYEVIERVASVESGSPAESGVFAGKEDADATKTEPAFDYNAALARVGGDVQLLRDIAEIFCNDGPTMLADIERQIARRNAAGLERAAHALKGSVANFGARGAFESARALEMMGREGNLAGAPETFDALERQIERLIFGLVEFTKPSPG